MRNSWLALAKQLRHLTLTSVPDGAEAIPFAELALASSASGLRAVYVARDGQRLAQMRRALNFFAPQIGVLEFPAWDCLPYDRASPTPAVVAERMNTLIALASREKDSQSFVLLTTINALMQRILPVGFVDRQIMVALPGQRVDRDALIVWLENNGFSRASTVRDTGDYAVRGGIIDLFAPGADLPVRLDFFGDTLESLRSFDPETQRTESHLQRIDLTPMSEVQLTPLSIKRFRQAYVSAFGAATVGDPLYEAVSEGRRYPGIEHWLGFFHETLATLFDHVGAAPFMFDPLTDEAVNERLLTIHDHYEARFTALRENATGTPYKPAHPSSLYLDRDEYQENLAARTCIHLTPFQPGAGLTEETVDFGGRAGRSFALERAGGDINIFDALIAYIRALTAEKRRAVLACWSEGSRERLMQVIADHNGPKTHSVSHFEAALKVPPSALPVAVLGLESGFETTSLVVIAEQDVLGDRLIRSAKARKRPENFLTEAGTLHEGDLVVHIEHGIGRFVGLKTIEALGAPHDCLELHYAGGDRLFLPVENIELLSRYGSQEGEVALDKLGGVAWQARKARLKRRILEIAGELMRTAAARLTRPAPALTPSEGLYDEFIARFPYDETDDQLAAIAAVIEDMAAGRPMDRLICGDVGFGKTEVALRAAFIAAASGKQVAVVVPTTLLARQHFRTFSERFKGLPIKVAQASRLVPTKELKALREALKEGRIDIVIGTHALLAQGIAFHDLGLLIIDEEQHFGVKHKERLKELKTDVHVLTLSATPIPRTLQLALTGVRELSLIATPPVDRLAVRSFIAPFDPLTIREALLREKYRGGQAFYVCPRIADLAEQQDFLVRHVPEVKVAVAHGQMAAGTLEDIMNAFYDGHYDVLLSTSIVESGLDIPTANTLIVYRADMFGLAQLYQLKGRVGRAKTRAYALFTVPAERRLTMNAERRLKVLQGLDTLGAGFELASHDLDIRGAGNLLGEEQSGHIREVGYELYQQMLEEAITALKEGTGTGDAAEAGWEEQWSPQIAIDTAVMIPESYVPDLALRLSLYRRLAGLDDSATIDAFGAELIDRFGPLPNEVKHLLRIVALKVVCRKANVERVEIGPKGMVVAFRENRFADPTALLNLVAREGVLAKVRPDQKLVFIRDWQSVDQRLAGAAQILMKLAEIATETKREALTRLAPSVPPEPKKQTLLKHGTYPSLESFKKRK